MSLDLNDKTLFPVASDLPDEASLDVNLKYVKKVANTYVPIRRWCLLVEIIKHTENTLRPTYQVKDIEGREFRVGFYVPTSQFVEIIQKCQPGYTMAIMFAGRNVSDDDTLLIPVRELKALEVLPCALEELVEVAKRMDQTTVCIHCGNVAKLKCSRCGSPFCNKECLQQNWKLAHKRQCVAVQKLQEWNTLTWDTYAYA
ncbi:hypothetical protein BDN72DRAFT_583844 [Pluteus cervinus]|uniref:Uncharacterized protein n=1 Tax=Pluteus cervinus TaxID=181527 RepID=A0ACD3AVU6_9AGAR|nr:hypothetical protein BDN72DRAFT_583844 [Pluteus cervinus]